jgi:hypothetical protein
MYFENVTTRLHMIITEKTSPQRRREPIAAKPLKFKNQISKCKITNQISKIYKKQQQKFLSICVYLPTVLFNFCIFICHFDF